MSFALSVIRVFEADCQFIQLSSRGGRQTPEGTFLQAVGVSAAHQLPAQVLWSRDVKLPTPKPTQPIKVKISQPADLVFQI
jgi:hypothetical protein